jgi:hypothetical protein
MEDWTRVLQEASSCYTEPAAPRDPRTLDAILYINLAHREDRRESVEAEIQSIRHLTKHVERIDAIKHANGGKGCALSHLKAFDRILDSDWDTVLILEDDAVLDMSVSSFESKLKHALCVPFDVTVCGSEIYDQTMDAQCMNGSVPLTSAQCTTAYIIRKAYVPVLRRVWTHCKDNLGNRMMPLEYRVFAIDQGWKRLITQHTWRWLTGNAFRQLPGFSDIEQKKVNYKWVPRRLKNAK